MYIRCHGRKNQLPCWQPFQSVCAGSHMSRAWRLGTTTIWDLRRATPASRVRHWHTQASTGPMYRRLRAPKCRVGLGLPPFFSYYSTDLSSTLDGSSLPSSPRLTSYRAVASRIIGETGLQNLSAATSSCRQDERHSLHTYECQKMCAPKAPTKPPSIAARNGWSRAQVCTSWPGVPLLVHTHHRSKTAVTRSSAGPPVAVIASKLTADTPPVCATAIDQQEARQG